MQRQNGGEVTVMSSSRAAILFVIKNDMFDSLMAIARFTYTHEKKNYL